MNFFIGYLVRIGYVAGVMLLAHARSQLPDICLEGRQYCVFVSVACGGGDLL